MHLAGIESTAFCQHIQAIHCACFLVIVQINCYQAINRQEVIVFSHYTFANWIIQRALHRLQNACPLSCCLNIFETLANKWSPNQKFTQSFSRKLVGWLDGWLSCEFWFGFWLSIVSHFNFNALWVSEQWTAKSSTLHLIRNTKYIYVWQCLSSKMSMLLIYVRKLGKLSGIHRCWHTVYLEFSLCKY